MTDQQQRDPQDWVTGDEPMTDAQASYLRTLSEESGEPFDEGLTKAQASERIDELRQRSPRLNQGDATAGSGEAQHPDTPRDATVEEELTPATRSQMETLGQPPSDEESAESPGPGQNSDRLPQ